MIFISRLSCISAVFSLFFSSAIGQQDFKRLSITGIVIDSSTGFSLNKATVELKDDSNRIKHLVTKEDGSFIFPDLKPRDYSLTVTVVGFQKKILQVIGVDSSISMMIRMSKMYGMLENITVIGRKPIIIQKIDGISYDLQADPDSKSSNVLEAVQKC